MKPPPRIIRLSEAPSYLGMSPRIFNGEVRPHLDEIKIGSRGVGFDRRQLDEWIERNLQNKEAKNSGTV